MRILSLILILALPVEGSALEAPFTISVEKSNDGVASVYGIPPEQKKEPENLVFDLNGIEASECRPYGRKSAVKAEASVRVLEKRRSHVALGINATAYTHGGHYRICGTCFGSNCIGISGNDTEAKVRLKPSARVIIEFNKTYLSSHYALQLTGTYSGSEPEIRLSDRKGQIKRLSLSDSQNLPIDSSAGSIYYIDVIYPLASSNKGGCCDERKSISSRIDLKIIKEPILSSVGAIVPYIVGGEETQSYKNVGALLLNGRLHCTGTLVSPKTILTAAHCLHGYDDQINSMTVLFGSNLLQPTDGPFKVNKIQYPKESDSGYKFNPETLEDDIGLVHISTPILSVRPIKLHFQTPTWQSILDDKRNLIFVGFGYDVIDDQKVGAGIKREAAWAINGVSNRRVTFKVPDKNTCKGDSGGPAFIIQSRELLQAGITSGGDQSCTEGFETRIDAYHSWLQGKFE